MKCENCIHFDVCANQSRMWEDEGYRTDFNTRDDAENMCQLYKDKSLFVELPCKVGDTVYMPWKWNGQKGIAQLRVTTMLEIIGLGLDFGTNFETDDDAYYEEYNGGRFEIEDVGKTVFLTKEEAEKALKEKQG